MPEAHKRAYRHPKYKTSYRIKNWPEYETSLRNRGDITLWLSRDAVDACTPPKNRKRGFNLLMNDAKNDITIEGNFNYRVKWVHDVFTHKLWKWLIEREYPKERSTYLLTSGDTEIFARPVNAHQNRNNSRKTA